MPAANSAGIPFWFVLAISLFTFAIFLMYFVSSTVSPLEPALLGVLNLSECGRVISEIYGTEEAYVGHLQTCVTVIVEPVLSAAADDDSLAALSDLNMNLEGMRRKDRVLIYIEL